MTTFTADPISALRIAARNPLPTLLGAASAIVPIGGYYVGHSQLSSWSPMIDPLSLLAYAALAFSGSTVYDWSTAMFGSRLKAVAFTVLIEGLMMFGGSPALAYVSLGLLVAINAMTCGARLAIRSAVAEPAAIAAPLAVVRGAPSAGARRAARYSPTSVQRRPDALVS